MATAEQVDLRKYCLDVAQRARAGGDELARASGQAKIDWLKRSAALLRERAEEVIAANQLDIDAAPGYGLSDAAIDRLRLTTGRIESIASALEEVAALADPV